MIINKILIKIPQFKKIIIEKNNYLNENLELKKNLEIIKKTNETYVNFDWAKEMLIKKESFKINKYNIQTLIIGSSHGDYAVNPLFLKNTFNMSMSSQDLYYSYYLYKKNNTKKIKNIILFYSVFSQGFNLIKTSEKQRCLLYSLIFDIPFQSKIDILEIEKNKYIQYLNNLKKNLIIDNNYLGYEQHHFFIKLNNSIKNRAKKHYKENIRNNSQLIYIEKICKLAKNNNQNIFIVIPPAQEKYRSYIPKSDILFKKILETTNKFKIKIFNFYEDKRFLSNDFWDSDHLNNRGAIKLTKLLKNNI